MGCSAARVEFNGVEFGVSFKAAASSEVEEIKAFCTQAEKEGFWDDVKA